MLVRFVARNESDQTATVLTDDFRIVDANDRDHHPPSSDANTALAAAEVAASERGSRCGIHESTSTAALASRCLTPPRIVQRGRARVGNACPRRHEQTAQTLGHRP